MACQPPDPPVPDGLKRALAWRTLLTLVRRHRSLGLRIMQTRPGGGMYDCLTLIQLDPLRTLVDFNVPGSGLRLERGALGPRRRAETWGHDVDDEVWRYPAAALRPDRDALARDIEAFVGFPEREPAPPRTWAPGIAMAVLGLVLDRLALSSTWVDLRCGWRDSAGMEGSALRPWVPGRDDPPTGPDAWRVHMRHGLRFWGLEVGYDVAEPAVVIDLGTSAWWSGGKARMPLAARWAEGAGLRRLAWEVEEAVLG